MKQPTNSEFWSLLGKCDDRLAKWAHCDDDCPFHPDSIALCKAVLIVPAEEFQRIWEDLKAVRAACGLQCEEPSRERLACYIVGFDAAAIAKCMSEKSAEAVFKAMESENKESIRREAEILRRGRRR